RFLVAAASSDTPPDAAYAITPGVRRGDACTMWSVPPVSAASAVASCTARCAVSEPSVPTTITLYTGRSVVADAVACNRCRLLAVRLGIAHHFGWAVAVTASDDREVVDRRRMELIEPGVPAAPIHHEGKPLDDAAATALVQRVRASSRRATAA